MLGNYIMKQVLFALLLLNIYFKAAVTMESEARYKCDKKECKTWFFTKEKLASHQQAHRSYRKNKRILVYDPEEKIPAPAVELTSLAHVVLTSKRTQMMPYKKFCEIEANTISPYGVIRSISALPIVKPKSKIGKKYWYIKKDECCKQLADQHPSKYKLHILQEHPERYNTTMHPLDCLRCEHIKSRQTDLHLPVL